MIYRILLAAIFLAITSCKTEVTEKITLKGAAFGTTYAVTYFGATTKTSTIQNGIEEIIDSVNQSMSTYIADSDISKINRGDTTVIVNDLFQEVFRLSDSVNSMSKGYFDPTIGVLRNAYGFGDAQPLLEIDSLRLDSLMQMVGWNKIRLTDQSKIEKKHPKIYFDFNAVAKGYGIDLIARYLRRRGKDNYLIELGGELRAKGANLDNNQPWIVGIEAIDSKLINRSYQAVIPLNNLAMASSGNYRKNRKDPTTGATYVHTINPITGKAIENDVLSATVLAPTCAAADAWATAFMAMGLERSKETLKTLEGIDAYLVYTDGQAKNGVFMTTLFKVLLE